MNATRLVMISTAVLLMIGSGIAFSAWRHGDGARRLTVVARGMAFYLEGQDQANPTITLPTDARITIELRNEDPGMLHDLVIEGLVDARTIVLRSGNADQFTFQTPPTPTATDYLCSLHGQMMRGRIRFE